MGTPAGDSFGDLSAWQAAPSGPASTGIVRTDSGTSSSSADEGIVHQATSAAKENLESTVDTGRNIATEAVRSVGQSLSNAGHELERRNNSAGQLIARAGERLEEAAKDLQGARLDDIVDRTERWARENPALFLGAAFAIGVLGARFLKSSRPPRASTAPRRPAAFSDRQVPLVVEGEGA